MKKRIAYIGLSYPLFYDYKNQAGHCKNDGLSSPNPILESPMGLLILYDELVFLCESLCPENMRRLPYVKYVDTLFPDIYLTDIQRIAMDNAETMGDIQTDFGYWGVLRRSMNLDPSRFRVDNHSHSLQIADIRTSASFSAGSIAFDFGVFSFLKHHYNSDIEFVGNSMTQGFYCDSNVIELAETIVLQDIPNYLSRSGPYHSCMEELRGSDYLVSFRKWIIENHAHIEKSEIKDVTEAVHRTIREKEDQLFLKYLRENSGFSCFKSISKTIAQNFGGGITKAAINIATTLWGFCDDLTESASSMNNLFEVSSTRWQGFVVDSRKTIEVIKSL